MFNSFYGETLKTYQNWVAGSFRSPAVPDRVRDYVMHLAWSPDSGRIFIVECKRLQTASTVREVVQQLARFAGDKEERDSLGRHLRRIEWIEENPSSLVGATGIPENEMCRIPHLVTSYATPMQYFAGIDFPVEQIVPISDLPSRIAARRGST